MRKTEKRMVLPCCSTLIALLFLAGCLATAGRKAPEPASKDEKAEPSVTQSEERKVPQKRPSDLVHTVRWRGESLSLIAKWYTGETANWRLLAEYNALAHPDRIRIGDTIRIPESRLTNRSALPRTFLEQEGQRTEEPDAPAETPRESGSPELFGPKEYTPD